MGCWNETCALSRMAIKSGEAVRFLPIIHNPYHYKQLSGFKGNSPVLYSGQSGCYIGDLWSPLCFPIRGKYNDYGSIEGVPEETAQDKAELAQFIQAFKINCVPLELGDNEYHDPALKKFTLEEILECLQEGRVFVTYKPRVPQFMDNIVPVAWMMIKESVWQSMLNTDITKADENWWVAYEKKQGTKDHWTLGGIKDRLKELIDAKKRDIELQSIKDKKDYTDEDFELVIKAIGSFRTNATYRSKAFHQSAFDAPEITENIIDTVAELEYVHSIMSLLRINYAPTTGSGSQNRNLKIWKTVYKNFGKLAATEVAKQTREENEESQASEKKRKKKRKAKK